MKELSYLAACYWLGSQYHSGQASYGYQLMHMAAERARREFQVDMGNMVDNLQKRRLYLEGGNFRRNVAWWLRRLRRFRGQL